jgi:molecular chaperone GrpE (heat shock protein)
MVQNEEDDNSSIKSQENVEQNDNNFNNTEDDISFIDESKVIVDKQQIDELNDLLQKEKEKSLRLQADYQNLEKQTIDRINTHGDKIILDFLTVY